MTRPVVWLAILAGSPLLAAPAAPPRPTPGLTDREAARQAPPAPWRGHGWRTVFPHAYAMQRRVSVRATPDPSGSVEFELIGGMRVPVYEQRGAWWRVGGTKARTGWVRAAEMAPHARCVMLDAGTGRVIRQFATKGQWSVLPRPDALWALADTGLTRVAWDGTPHFWSNGTASDADSSMVRDAVWSEDGRKAAVISRRDPVRADVVSLADGTTTETVSAGTDTQLQGFQSFPHLFSLATHNGSPLPNLFDPFQKRRIERAGDIMAVAPTGDTFVQVAIGDSASGKPAQQELQRWDSGGRTLARWKLNSSVYSAVLSADQRYLLATRPSDGGGGILSTVLDPTQLRPLVTFKLSDEITERAGHDPQAFFRRPGGWLTVAASPEEDAHLCLAEWDDRGNLRSARPYDQAWAASQNGKRLYLASDRFIERREVQSGATQKLPLAWSRPLLKQYLTPVMGGNPHWEITFLTLTPDEKTLIVLERLAGDPEG